MYKALVSKYFLSLFHSDVDMKYLNLVYKFSVLLLVLK